MPGTLTKRSDLIIPQILVEAIQGEFEDANLLAGTGVAVQSPSLPNDKKGGDTVTVPYFGTLGEMEDIENEGDALTPESLSMSSETATVTHSGKAFSITEWARMSEAGDAYAEAARQFRVITQRRVDLALITKATAGLSSDYILDISALPTANKISYDAMIDAAGLWQDEFQEIVLMGVHSKVYRDLLHMKDSTGRHMLELPSADQPIPRFMGIPVVVSNKCTKTVGSPDTYETLLCKRAALAFWWQNPPKVVTDYDALADTDVLAIHMYWAAHRYLRQRGSTRPGIVKLVTQ